MKLATPQNLAEKPLSKQKKQSLIQILANFAFKTKMIMFLIFDAHHFLLLELQVFLTIYNYKDYL